jgi:signal transduction histidine kinase
MLAVGPLVTVGIFDYLRTRRMVEQLILAQTDTVARRAAKTIADRYAIVASDILLFSENSEVQRLFRALEGGDSTAIRASRDSVDAYLHTVWQLAANTYYSAELLTDAGEVAWRARSDSTAALTKDAPLILREPIHDVTTRRVVGSLVLVPRPNALWSRDVLGPSFGRTGYGALIDRRTNRILAHPMSSLVLQPAGAALGATWMKDSARVASQPAGTLVYHERDSLRIASFVSLTSPPWTVLSSTAVREFGDTFASARRQDIVFLIVMTGVVAIAFVIFIGRATRRLEELTRAASAIGRGDLSPPLPAAGVDEVGTLTTAFADMTSRIRSMMLEIEVSHQLAAIGEFAAQLSHEVRNPLTSLKLDLQGMQRQLRAGTLPPSIQAPVESSLREVNRLESVVGGVLELARRPAPKRTEFCLDEVLDHALTALHAQLAEHRVVVDRRSDGLTPRLAGDPELLSGMFMNLLINAADAQPNGGRIAVQSGVRRATDGTQWVDVTVADDGPGIPIEKREEIFRPFYTSRPGGTGLGLALALRTANVHGGHIACEGATNGLSGATFIVSIPVPS